MHVLGREWPLRFYRKQTKHSNLLKNFQENPQGHSNKYLSNCCARFRLFSKHKTILVDYVNRFQMYPICLLLFFSPSQTIIPAQVIRVELEFPEFNLSIFHHSFLSLYSRKRKKDRDRKVHISQLAVSWLDPVEKKRFQSLAKANFRPLTLAYFIPQRENWTVSLFYYTSFSAQGLNHVFSAPRRAENELYQDH